MYVHVQVGWGELKLRNLSVRTLWITPTSNKIARLKKITLKVHTHRRKINVKKTNKPVFAKYAQKYSDFVSKNLVRITFH